MAKRATKPQHNPMTGKWIGQHGPLTLGEIADLKPWEHPDPRRQAIGKRLQDLLTQQRRDKYELAVLCGVTTNAVTQWIIGKTEPSTENYVLIADYLHVNVDYLIRVTPTRRSTREPVKKIISRVEAH